MHLNDTKEDGNGGAQNEIPIKGPSSEGEVDSSDQVELLKEAMGILLPRHRKILEMVLGLNGSEIYTFEEIGNLLNPKISKERVRQIKVAAIKQLKNRLDVPSKDKKSKKPKKKRATRSTQVDTSAFWAWGVRQSGFSNAEEKAVKYVSWWAEAIVVLGIYLLGVSQGQTLLGVVAGVAFLLLMHLKRVVINDQGDFVTQWVWEESHVRGPPALIVLRHFALHLFSFMIYFGPFLYVASFTAPFNPLSDTLILNSLLWAFLSHLVSSLKKQIIDVRGSTTFLGRIRTTEYSDASVKSMENSQTAILEFDRPVALSATNWNTRTGDSFTEEEVASASNLGKAFSFMPLELDLIDLDKKILDPETMANILETEMGYKRKMNREQVQSSGDFFIYEEQGKNKIYVIIPTARYPLNGLALQKNGDITFVNILGKSGSKGANYWTMKEWLTEKLGWTPVAFFAFDNGMDPTWNQRRNNEMTPVQLSDGVTLKGRANINATLAVSEQKNWRNRMLNSISTFRESFVKRFQIKGWSDRKIVGVIGALEEIFFSFILVGGGAFLLNHMFDFPMQEGLLLMSIISGLIFFRFHMNSVMKLVDGKISRAPPTIYNLINIAALSIILRSLFLALLNYLPFGSWNILAALSLVMFAHGFLYNTFIAPFFGLVLGVTSLVPSKYLSDGQVFLVPGLEGKPALHIEISLKALMGGLNPIAIKRFADAIHRTNRIGVTSYGRSVLLRLADGQAPLTAVGSMPGQKLKNVGYKDRLPDLTKTYVAGPDEAISQPTHKLEIVKGKIHSVPVLPHPVGGGYLFEVINEYETMLEAFNDGVPTAYPEGVGEFLGPEWKFNDKEVGFIIMGLEDDKDERVGDVIHARLQGITGMGSQGIPIAKKIYDDFGDWSYKSAQTLRRNLAIGMTHGHPHPRNFGVPKNGVSRLYDYTNAKPIHKMDSEFARNEFIIRGFNDFRTFYLNTFILCSQGAPILILRQIFAFLGVEKTPNQKLVEGFFTKKDIEMAGDGDYAKGLQLIQAATREELFSTSHDLFWNKNLVEGKGVGEINWNLFSLFEKILGAQFDELALRSGSGTGSQVDTFGTPNPAVPGAINDKFNRGVMRISKFLGFGSQGQLAAVGFFEGALRQMGVYVLFPIVVWGISKTLNLSGHLSTAPPVLLSVLVILVLFVYTFFFIQLSRRYFYNQHLNKGVITPKGPVTNNPEVARAATRTASWGYAGLLFSLPGFLLVFLSTDPLWIVTGWVFVGTGAIVGGVLHGRENLGSGISTLGKWMSKLVSVSSSAFYISLIIGTVSMLPEISSKIVVSLVIIFFALPVLGLIAGLIMGILPAAEESEDSALHFPFNENRIHPFLPEGHPHIPSALSLIDDAFRGIGKNDPLRKWLETNHGEWVYHWIFDTEEPTRRIFQDTWRTLSKNHDKKLYQRARNRLLELVTEERKNHLANPKLPYNGVNPLRSTLTVYGEPGIEHLSNVRFPRTVTLTFSEVEPGFTRLIGTKEIARMGSLLQKSGFGYFHRAQANYARMRMSPLNGEFPLSYFKFSHFERYWMLFSLFPDFPTKDLDTILNSPSVIEYYPNEFLEYISKWKQEDIYKNIDPEIRARLEAIGQLTVSSFPPARTPELLRELMVHDYFVSIGKTIWFALNDYADAGDEAAIETLKQWRKNTPQVTGLVNFYRAMLNAALKNDEEVFYRHMFAEAFARYANPDSILRQFGEPSSFAEEKNFFRHLALYLGSIKIPEASQTPSKKKSPVSRIKLQQWLTTFRDTYERRNGSHKMLFRQINLNPNDMPAIEIVNSPDGLKVSNNSKLLSRSKFKILGNPGNGDGEMADRYISPQNVWSYFSKELTPDLVYPEETAHQMTSLFGQLADNGTPIVMAFRQEVTSTGVPGIIFRVIYMDDEAETLDFEISSSILEHAFTHKMPRGIEGKLILVPDGSGNLEVLKFGDPSKTKKEFDWLNNLPPALKTYFPRVRLAPVEGAYFMELLIGLNLEQLLLKREMPPNKAVTQFLRIYDGFVKERKGNEIEAPENWRTNRGAAKAMKATHTLVEQEGYRVKPLVNAKFIEIENENNKFLNLPEVSRRLAELIKLDQFDLLKPGKFGLIHGDLKPDNMFLNKAIDPSGDMGPDYYDLIKWFQNMDHKYPIWNDITAEEIPADSDTLRFNLNMTEKGLQNSGIMIETLRLMEEELKKRNPILKGLPFNEWATLDFWNEYAGVISNGVPGVAKLSNDPADKRWQVRYLMAVIYMNRFLKTYADRLAQLGVVIPGELLENLPQEGFNPQKSIVSQLISVQLAKKDSGTGSQVDTFGTPNPAVPGAINDKFNRSVMRISKFLGFGSQGQLAAVGFFEGALRQMGLYVLFPSIIWGIFKTLNLSGHLSTAPPVLLLVSVILLLSVYTFLFIELSRRYFYNQHLNKGVITSNGPVTNNSEVARAATRTASWGYAGLLFSLPGFLLVFLSTDPLWIVTGWVFVGTGAIVGGVLHGWKNAKSRIPRLEPLSPPLKLNQFLGGEEILNREIGEFFQKKNSTIQNASAEELEELVQVFSGKLQENPLNLTPEQGLMLAERIGARQGRVIKKTDLENSPIQMLARDGDADNIQDYLNTKTNQRANIIVDDEKETKDLFNGLAEKLGAERVQVHPQEKLFIKGVFNQEAFEKALATMTEEEQKNTVFVLPKALVLELSAMKGLPMSLLYHLNYVVLEDLFSVDEEIQVRNLGLVIGIARVVSIGA
ncbi:MAG: sigma factor-like helix-turn-helix DNA-binding protein [Elusimicrobiota bacterium]